MEKKIVFHAPVLSVGVARRATKKNEIAEM